MTTTLTALYDTREAALGAVRDLKVVGLEDTDMSLIASGDPAPAMPQGDGDVLVEAGAGAAVGAGVGGTGGLLAGLGLITIPGIGPVLAAGWLATAAAGAVAGAAVGGAAGGLIGALVADGVGEDDAHLYAEAVRRGGTLVIARVPNLRLEAARTVLDARRAVDPATRRAAYRDEGWTGFDPDAPRPAPRDTRPDRPV
ncbi:hypothetical protein [Aquabacter spiritensis]|uniref:Heat induced stress protein YflT n=1 Tax=Aquabacter spiritensis TaxID=933073 RepID=A0A4R3M485_9HYPH|nr:hypothetical protein [Aquabacter spiritensis]TCT07636.1 hypothetical protein EDC64_101155 [Aquabacter spiritensis]